MTNRVLTLDCTLRDGGYINNWNFGSKNIRRILEKLSDANIDIIECGFFSQDIEYDKNVSIFDTMDRITQFISSVDKQFIPAFMINYGSYDIDSIPQCDASCQIALRVCFHKKDFHDAMAYCKKIKEKGYSLFVQPMVSVSYTDKEFLQLIDMANEIDPFAFYIVDSFGVMRGDDLMRLYYLVDHNLDDSICLGYHPHNNIQMAFSNAQSLVELKTERDLVIDSSVLGMGRGAGNLNTELFIEYLNERGGGKFRSIPLLQLIDQVMENMSAKYRWGYSLPHYLSSLNNCHPNYATFLNEKKTLTVEDINDILVNLDNNKRNVFDRDYIADLYTKYQSYKIDDKAAKKDLKEIFSKSEVIILAPGKSLREEYDLVNNKIENSDAKVVSINFMPDDYKCDYVFFSNHHRYENYDLKSADNLILTSNVVNGQNNGFVVNYSSLLCNNAIVRDNSGLMLIKLLVDVGVKSIKIAGMDGYSKEPFADYANSSMSIQKPIDIIDDTNSGLESSLKEFSKQVEIEFLTKSRYF